MRRISFILSFLCISILLKSQDKPVQMAISINPGTSWAKAENQYYQSEGSSFAFSYGVDVDFFFAKNYAFSTGLHIQHYTIKYNHPDTYSASGSSDDLISVHSYNSTKYQAFELPAYLKLVSNPIGYNSIFAEFGVSMFFPFKANQSVVSDKGNDSSVDRGTYDAMGDNNFMSVNLLLGAGLELPFSGSTKFQVGLRYLNGITSLSNQNTYKVDGNGSVIADELLNGEPSGPKEKIYSNVLALSLKLLF